MSEAIAKHDGGCEMAFVDLVRATMEFECKHRIARNDDVCVFISIYDYEHLLAKHDPYHGRGWMRGGKYGCELMVRGVAVHHADVPDGEIWVAIKMKNGENR